jgi:hypothetical protein
MDPCTIASCVFTAPNCVAISVLRACNPSCALCISAKNCHAPARRPTVQVMSRTSRPIEIGRLENESAVSVFRSTVMPPRASCGALCFFRDDTDRGSRI